MGRRGPKPYEDVTGQRTEAMPILKVSKGEKAAYNEAAARDGYESWADWVRDLMRGRARKLKIELPKQQKQKSDE